jgi:hypothetical protein
MSRSVAIMSRKLRRLMYMFFVVASVVRSCIWCLV